MLQESLDQQQLRFLTSARLTPAHALSEAALSVIPKTDLSFIFCEHSQFRMPDVLATINELVKTRRPSELVIMLEQVNLPEEHRESTIHLVENFLNGDQDIANGLPTLANRSGYDANARSQRRLFEGLQAIRREFNISIKFVPIDVPAGHSATVLTERAFLFESLVEIKRGQLCESLGPSTREDIFATLRNELESEGRACRERCEYVRAQIPEILAGLDSNALAVAIMGAAHFDVSRPASYSAWRFVHLISAEQGRMLPEVAQRAFNSYLKTQKTYQVSSGYPLSQQDIEQVFLEVPMLTALMPIIEKSGQVSLLEMARTSGIQFHLTAALIRSLAPDLRSKILTDIFEPSAPLAKATRFDLHCVLTVSECLYWHILGNKEGSISGEFLAQSWQRLSDQLLWGKDRGLRLSVE